MIKRITDYISDDIWSKKEQEYKSAKVRWAVRQFKVLLFTARGFGEHEILVRSAALTFYTIMSLVPIAALIFGIAKGFGLETHLNEYLYAKFPQYTMVIDQIIEFANALLQRTKGGVIASVGLVVLFWAVIKVFGNVENAFNNIWEVRKSRSFTRKFSDYMTVVFVTPILWIVSNSVLIQVQTEILHWSESILLKILFWFISLLTLWLMFGFIYSVMPNIKVRIKSALVAGIIAGTLFHLFQIGYFYVQTEISSYNAIYGSFAAVPLFLLWLQASWQIVLFGGELSFAYQNITRFEYEKQAGKMSYAYRKRAIVVVMGVIVKHFVKDDGAVSSEKVATEINLPVRIVRDVIFDLEKAGLIVSINSRDEKVNLYVPARDVHGITVQDVIRQVEAVGKDTLGMKESLEFNRVTHILDRLEETLHDSNDNIRIMDLDLEAVKKKSSKEARV